MKRVYARKTMRHRRGFNENKLHWTALNCRTCIHGEMRNDKIFPDGIQCGARKRRRRTFIDQFGCEIDVDDVCKYLTRFNAKKNFDLLDHHAQEDLMAFQCGKSICLVYIYIE